MNKRQQIISALKTRLQTIKISNGYNTDAGNKVYVWRKAAVKAGEPLLLNIKYAAEPDTIDSEGLKGPKNIWNRVMVVGITAVYRFNDVSEAEAVMADVWKAIGIDDNFGNLVVTTDPTGDSIMEEQDEDLITGAIMTMNISYRTNLYDLTT